MKINYPTVVVCAVAHWMLGGLWYGLLFGPRWMALENITIEQGKSMNSANEFYPLVGLCLMGAILGAWTKKSA